MNKVCRIFTYVFAAAYVLALGIYLIGAFGLFGQQVDPLSGIFLIPLGFPWYLAFDLITQNPGPIAALAPILNLILIVVICRLTRSRVWAADERGFNASYSQSVLPEAATGVQSAL